MKKLTKIFLIPIIISGLLMISIGLYFFSDNYSHKEIQYGTFTMGSRAGITYSNQSGSQLSIPLGYNFTEPGNFSYSESNFETGFLFSQIYLGIYDFQEIQTTTHNFFDESQQKFNSLTYFHQISHSLYYDLQFSMEIKCNDTISNFTILEFSNEIIPHDLNAQVFIPLMDINVLDENIFILSFNVVDRSSPTQFSSKTFQTHLKESRLNISWSLEWNAYCELSSGEKYQLTGKNLLHQMHFSTKNESGLTFVPEVNGDLTCNYQMIPIIVVQKRTPILELSLLFLDITVVVVILVKKKKNEE